MLSTYLGFWKRSQWLNYDACNFFSVQCALLNMFLVDLLRSAMLSLNMSTCSIWVAGRAKQHKRIRSVASERVCKLWALYHEASNSAIFYVTSPFNTFFFKWRLPLDLIRLGTEPYSVSLYWKLSVKLKTGVIFDYTFSLPSLEHRLLWRGSSTYKFWNNNH